MARNRSLLDGFEGKVKRLRETYDILSATWPVASSPDSLIDAMQTGDRISYYPGTAFAELTAFQAKLAGLTKVIEAMHATESSPAFASRIRDQNLSRQVLDYNRLIDTALAHVADVNESHPVAAYRHGMHPGSP